MSEIDGMIMVKMRGFRKGESDGGAGNKKRMERYWSHWAKEGRRDCDLTERKWGRRDLM